MQEDIQFVADLLADPESKVCVHDSKIFATRMSNGGGFIGSLTCDPVGNTFFKGDGAETPGLPPNDLDQKNGDDGAYARGTVEELLHSSRQSISPFEVTGTKISIRIQAGVKRIEKAEVVKLRNAMRTNSIRSKTCPAELQRQLLSDITPAIVQSRRGRAVHHTSHKPQGGSMVFRRTPRQLTLSPL